MLIYDYYCRDNGQNLIVRHGQSEAIRTWGELCRAASTDVGSTSGDALAERRTQVHCTCTAGCHHYDEQHHQEKHRRISWFSSRLGRAVSKGLGFGLISAIVITPCPCCGGVILACLRGLLSAAIGLIVGVVAYLRKPAAATPGLFDVSSDAAGGRTTKLSVDVQGGSYTNISL